MDANELNALGMDLKDAGRYEEAEETYRRATDARPGVVRTLVQLGHLGIAATAIGDWRLARHAWRGYGVKGIPDGDGPFNLRWGPVPIRLNPDGDGEVVWCDRLDPARALIRNVPLPQSGFREGDVVLNDGEPKGQRKLHGEPLDVFDALQLLERSPRNTFEARIQAETQGDIDALERIAEQSKVVAEDWSRSVRNICRKCSEGVPHEAHAYETPPWDPDHRIGLSALSLEQASSVLMEWASAAPSRQLVSVT